ncbi:hypothetical protein SISNIDRAFT_488965 [Sistotremastrum niveocremeum HHB9708]|uniref:Uncharacterized protein n=1 Tax=Sistotremastrum niveocremeum HHB9708 TaxID=1314777 RepID=A0A164QMD6_9AGAM|nr:hypothetical protein SISNIDRAFT_488965 [Sistotremastrum niveocremeum HHB9708]
MSANIPTELERAGLDSQPPNSPRVESLIRKVNQAPDARTKLQTLLKPLIDSVGEELKADIVKMKRTHPTFVLWHTAPDAPKALKKAKRQLLQYPPKSKGEGFARSISDINVKTAWSQMKDSLLDLLISYLQDQVGKHKEPMGDCFPEVPHMMSGALEVISEGRVS